MFREPLIVYHLYILRTPWDWQNFKYMKHALSKWISAHWHSNRSNALIVIWYNALYYPEKLSSNFQLKNTPDTFTMGIMGVRPNYSRAETVANRTICSSDISYNYYSYCFQALNAVGKAAFGYKFNALEEESATLNAFKNVLAKTENT